MKKSAAIFLLAIFLFNIVGYFLAFSVVKYQVRKEIKKQIKLGLPESELTFLHIAKSDEDELSWVESGKEFIYKDQMYDVVRVESKQDTTIYQCIKDTQEDALFAHLGDHVQKHIAENKPMKNNGAKKLGQHVIKIYFLSEVTYFLALTESIIEFPSINNVCVSAVKKVHSPPPELVS